MAHLFGYFDESGKHTQQRIISLSGLVGDYRRWVSMAEAWIQLLRDIELPHLHAADALRISFPFGSTGKAATYEERAMHVRPFIKSVVENLNGIAIAVSVDVEAYKKATELHREFSEDPHYFAFCLVVARILSFFSIPKALSVGLIFDDDEQTAIRCYQLLRKMKFEIPEAKRITSICFSDDKDSPQVQAADLFAYLSRLEATKIFANEPYDYESLFRAFGERMPDGRHLCMHAEFLGEPHLRTFMKKHASAIFSLRVRLPRPGGR